MMEKRDRENARHGGFEQQRGAGDEADAEILPEDFFAPVIEHEDNGFFSGRYHTR